MRIVLLVLLMFAWPAAAQMELVQLSDTVYAALQLHDQRFNDANSLIVVGDDGVVVVDAQANSANALQVIKFVGRVSDKPVRTLINTHWHSDHTQGNALYRMRYGDELVIIGHESLSRDVPGRAAADQMAQVKQVDEAVDNAETQLADGVGQDGQSLSADEREQQAGRIARARQWLDDNRGVVFLAPTKTFSARLVISAGATEIRLLHYRAHTDGDTLVYLPAEKILATGDVLDDLPYIGHGHPASWRDALQEIAELDVDVYVPGHGPVFRDDRKLEAVGEFLTALCDETGAARERGVTLDEATQALGFAASRRALAGDDEAAQHFFDAVLGEAIERAWQESSAP